MCDWSEVAAVGVAAGPAISRAVFQLRAAFLAVISGVAGLLNFAGALQNLVIDHQEVMTITLNQMWLS